MPKRIKINNQLIGHDQPVYIIAELSANHVADFELAQKIIRASKDAGADAVKLQTYTNQCIMAQSYRVPIYPCQGNRDSWNQL